MDICFFFDALDEYDGPPEASSKFLEDLVSKPGRTNDKVEPYPAFAMTQSFQRQLSNLIAGYASTEFNCKPHVQAEARQREL